MVHEGVAGVHFAVWAPHAQRVSVVGDFNAWDGRRHPMRKRLDTGVWEIFVPGVGEGTLYKYEIIGADGALLPLKADPVGFGAELRPSTASVVRDTAVSRGPTTTWMSGARRPRRAPRADRRSTRCISARGGAATATAGCPTTSSPTRSSPTPSTWASPISS